MRMRAGTGRSVRTSGQKKRVSAAVVLSAAAMAGLAHSAHAQITATWTNPAGGSWGTSTNWRNGVIPANDGDSADFSTLNLTSDATVTLDGNRTAGILLFGDTTPSNNWVVNAGTGNGMLMLVDTSASPTITVNTGTTATINAPITVTTMSGGGMPQELVLGGNGTLVINSTLITDGGAAHVTAGTTQFKNLVVTEDPGGSGPGVATLSVDSGAVARVTNTLTIQASPSGNMPLIMGGGTLQLRNASSSVSNPSIIYGVVPNSNADCGVYVTTNVDVGSSGTQWIVGNSNHNNFSVHDGDLVFQGSISGAGNFAYSGSPFNGDPFSLVFSGDNSAWTGSMTIVQGSFVPYSSGGPNLGISGHNALIFNPAAGQTAIMYLYGQDTTIGSLSGAGAGVMSIRNAEWTTDGSGAHTAHLSNATLTVNQTAAGTYAGNLVDGPSDRAPGNAVYFSLALNKSGPATLTLTGNNTYTGGTTVSQGTLEIAGTGTANPLGTGPIAINSGGTLKLTQSNILGTGVSVPAQSIAITGGTLTNNGSFNALGNVTLTGGTIAATAGPTPGLFEAFSLNGAVTTTASNTPSTLSSSGAGAGFHLSANTIFNVAQGTTANGQDLIVSGNLIDQNFAQAAGSRAGGLTKAGPGTLVLSGNNTYTGQTVVNAGKLLVTGTINSTAPLTVNAGTLAVNGTAAIHSSTIQLASGATLDGSAAGFSVASGQTLVAGHTGGGTSNDVLGNLTVGGTLDIGGLANPATLGLANNLSLTGGSLRFDLGTPSGTGSDLVKVGGNLSLTGANTVVINPTQGTLASGRYTLFNYTGSLTGGASNLAVGGAGTTRQTFTFDTATAGAVAVNVTGSAANLVWAGGTAANTWDVATTLNWKNGGSSDKFFNFDNVTFDDSGSNTPAVNIVGTVLPGSLTVNSTKDYTFGGTGSIGGSGGLTKSGTGTLTIGTTNTFAGPVTINGGTLVTAGLTNGGSASPLGAGTSVTLGNATLRYTGTADSSDRAFTLSGANGSIDVTNSAGTLTLSGPMGGSGGLTKLGAGTLSLAGSNSFAGSTTIQAGTLGVASDASLGAVPATAQANAIALAGGNLRFTGPATLNANRGISVSAAATIDAGPNNVTIGGPIVGTAPTLTFSGTGTLALTGANTYTANTVISGATVQVPSDAGLGSPSSLTLQNGGTVAFSADTMTDPSRPITLGTGGGGINSGGHAITIQGTISGSGNLKLGGGGTFTVASPNTYSGGTNLDAAVSRLTLGDVASLGTGPVVFQGATDFELPGLDGNVPNDIALSGTAPFIHWETTTGHAPALAGKITGGNSGLKLEFNLSDSNGEGGITLANPNNTFTVGLIDVNRGRIGVAANGALGNPNNLIFLDDTISGDGVAGAGFHFLAPNLHIPNPFQFNDYSNINVNGNDGEEISGNITGPGGNRGHDYYILGGTQNNGTSSGSLRLSGHNTFSQNVTIDPDTLLIAGSPTAFGTGNLTVSPGGSIGFDAAGVNTTHQNVSVSGDGVVRNNLPRGAIVNINGSNEYDAAITLGSNSTFGVENAADTLTLGGDITTNGSAITKIGPGTLALNGPNPAGVTIESLTIAAGAVQIGGASGAAGPFNGGQITIANGAKLRLPSAGHQYVSTIATLNLTGTATLDVGKSAVKFQDAAVAPATLRQLLVSGYHSGAWDGPGIDTSAASAGHGLGYAEGSDGVVQGLAAGSSLVKYTVLGDANLDNKVDFSDLLILAQHYGSTTATWDQGDFNYDSKVGFDDLLLLAQNYGQSQPAANQLAQLTPAFRADVQAAFAEVPEPSSCAVVGLAAVALLRRRRQA